MQEKQKMKLFSQASYYLIYKYLLSVMVYEITDGVHYCFI